MKVIAAASATILDGTPQKKITQAGAETVLLTASLGS